MEIKMLTFQPRREEEVVATTVDKTPSMEVNYHRELTGCLWNIQVDIGIEIVGF
jgi:hypothetical protein